MAIDEKGAQRILLVRAAERDGSGLLTEGDIAWAEDMAGREPDADDRSIDFAARRADWLCERLFERHPSLDGWLASLRWPGWLAGCLIVMALATGLLADVIGPGGRINLLAAPMLGILAWNLMVIGASLWAHLRDLRDRQRETSSSGAANRTNTMAHRQRQPQLAAGHTGRGGTLADLVERLIHWRLRSMGANRSGKDWRAGFVSEWLVASAPLNRARASSLLHLAAAVLAVAMLAGLYLRGLAFEYRAGWESTFLDADDVHRLLSVLLGPASLLNGNSLPEPSAMARLRFSSGPGENAGRWIHWYAITLLIFAIIPRLMLAGLETLRIRRLRSDFPLPWQDTRFTEWVQRNRQAAVNLLALPCGWRPSARNLEALTAQLHARWGKTASVSIAAPVQPEQADDPGSLPSLAGVSIVAIVFNLSATPERETHGALVDAVKARLSPGATLLVWVEESAFAARFGAQPHRLDERRESWQTMLGSAELRPLFVRLEGAD